jgi:hypothetical protein
MFKHPLIVVLIGFVAGYLSCKLLPGSTAEIKPVEPNQSECAAKNVLAENYDLDTYQILGTRSVGRQVSSEVVHSSEAMYSSHASSSVKSMELADVPEQAPTKNHTVNSESSNGVEQEKVITDEEIDEILPAPFNQQLKGIQGYFRDKYRNFYNTEQADNWDVLMKGRIEDAVYNNPYGKFLSIESFICKNGMCELRIYETKYGAWNLIMAEMQLQTWWEFGAVHSSGFAAQLNGVDVIGHYVLIDRKRN